MKIIRRIFNKMIAAAIVAPSPLNAIVSELPNVNDGKWHTLYYYRFPATKEGLYGKAFIYIDDTLMPETWGIVLDDKYYAKRLRSTKYMHNGGYVDYIKFIRTD